MAVLEVLNEQLARVPERAVLVTSDPSINFGTRLPGTAVNAFVVRPTDAGSLGPLRCPVVGSSAPERYFVSSCAKGFGFSAFSSASTRSAIFSISSRMK